jgi:hypothetical protein
VCLLRGTGWVFKCDLTVILAFEQLIITSLILVHNECVPAKAFNLDSPCLTSGHILARVTYAVWDGGWAGPRRGLVALTKISIFAPVRRESGQ